MKAEKQTREKQKKNFEGFGVGLYLGKGEEINIEERS